jgi:hypothetical protein
VQPPEDQSNLHLIKEILNEQHARQLTVDLADPLEPSALPSGADFPVIEDVFDGIMQRLR